jgi:serine O-acetyltransferase
LANGKIGFFERRRMDIRAVMERDPAARSTLEVISCYPGYKAVRAHRRAHWLWVRGFKLLARMVSQSVAKKTGIEIHPGAEIGEGLFIDHGHGVVIGETAILGKNVTLYQGVTLGGTGKDSGKRHPTIGDNVVIGAGAKVLGPFEVGSNSKVGAGAIVLKAVPENCTVVGNPGRIVRRNNQRVAVGPDLDQVNLPDPVKELVEELQGRLTILEECLRRVQNGSPCVNCEAQGSSDCPKELEGREREYVHL